MHSLVRCFDDMLHVGHMFGTESPLMDAGTSRCYLSSVIIHVKHMNLAVRTNAFLNVRLEQWVSIGTYAVDKAGW